MKQSCPKKVRTQCVWWEASAVGLLVFLAIYSIVVHVPGFSATKELILTLGGTFTVLWCLWVVRVFRDILLWWTDLQVNIDYATRLLEDTKQDIKELKSINNELSSR